MGQPYADTPWAQSPLPGTDPFDLGGTVSGIPLRSQTTSPNPFTSTAPTTTANPFTLPTLTPGGSGSWNTSMPVPTKLPLTVGGTPQQAGPAFDGSFSAVQRALMSGGWGATEDPNYWVQRIAETGGSAPDNLAYWQSRIAGGPKSVQPGGQYYDAKAVGGGNPFSDPATAPWASLVQSLTDKLQQPVNNPNLQPLLDYATKYFQQLQGPAYTPAQQQLYTTAALNPITQNRDAESQRIDQQFARRGIGPSSGILQSAQLSNDRNAQQLETQAQSQLALSAIGTQQQNLAQALNVGQTLAGILPTVQATNENRALTGVNLLSQIPALADTRLGLANQTLGAGSLNPASLIQLLMQGQQAGQKDTAAFWQTLGQLIPGLFS